MWSGAFPEPLTFSLRALRALRARPGDFDLVHDNQGLGYGLLGLRRLGLPLVTSVTTRSPSTGGSSWPGRGLARAARTSAAGTASSGCRAGWPGGPGR